MDFNSLLEDTYLVLILIFDFLFLLFERFLIFFNNLFKLFNHFFVLRFTAEYLKFQRFIFSFFGFYNQLKAFYLRFKEINLHLKLLFHFLLLKIVRRFLFLKSFFKADNLCFKRVSHILSFRLFSTLHQSTRNFNVSGI